MAEEIVRARKILQIPVTRRPGDEPEETLPSNLLVLPSPFERNDRRNPWLGRDVPIVREMRPQPLQKVTIFRVGYDWMGGDSFKYATRLRTLGRVAPGVLFAANVPVCRPQLLWGGHAVGRGEWSPDDTLCDWCERRMPEPVGVTFGLPTCPECLAVGTTWAFFEVQPYPDWRATERAAHKVEVKRRRKARSKTRFDRDVFEWVPKARGPTVPLPHELDEDDLVQDGRGEKLRSRREGARRRKETT